MQRGRFLVLLTLASTVPMLAILGACEDDQGFFGNGGDNEVLFAMQQKVDVATGAKKISAGYEFLSLAHQGGWSTIAFRDGAGEGSCDFERYDDRLGSEHVDNGGVATFTGGQLPAAGVQILANQPDTSLDGAGWATNDILNFDVTGFAMPRIRPSSMNAPAAELTIGAITPALAQDGSLALTTTDDITVAWTAVTEQVPTRVLVSLVTDEPGAAPSVTPVTDASANAIIDSSNAGDSNPGDASGVSVQDASLTSDAANTSDASTDASAPTHTTTPTTTTTAPSTDQPSGTVSCFTPAADGTVLIPHKWVAQLFSAVAPNTPVHGHLEISTHRQLTIRAQGGWLVYVVATTEHRSIPFTGQR